MGYIQALKISIHALREEGDSSSCKALAMSLNFYPRPPRGGRRLYEFFATAMYEFLSTPSARRATPTPPPRPADRVISIHALREEGDAPPAPPACGGRDFYPRPPRGGRQALPLWKESDSIFLSTPSARRATRRRTSCWKSFGFLSTPSARRATMFMRSCKTAPGYFYPRPPRGGRQIVAEARREAARISIHALREEGDGKNRDKISIFKQIIQHSARI